ncbi:MAG: DUF3597 domain-containing protein [Verrucomicrobiaceae bacterium]|nr:DUF3597 domain-containing protein [Verrucomicrobiaceae bacterium]
MSKFSQLMGRISGKTEEAVAEDSTSPVADMDVAARLTALAGENTEELDWKRSIVDLLKLVGMDTSYGARKELALELGYLQAEIDSKGSAEMNLWLHGEVLKKLVENGATVPAELLG